MSVFDAAVAAMSGTGDVFDRARGVITWLERQLADADPSELPAELHTGTGLFSDLHIYDPRQDMEEQLQRAHNLIREAELIYQHILAALP